MAASSPSLGARAVEYLPDHAHQYQSYQFAARENPRGEVDLSQRPLTLLDAIRAQTWSDASGAHADTSRLYVEHGGALHEGCECVQSIPGVKSNFVLMEDTASSHVYQQADSGNTFLGNDRQRELFTFPEGEVDAVTITASDLEGLQPMRFLSNNIIDFYIKYLGRRLSSEERNRFYFFNSFFFRKLLGNSGASTDIDDCEVGYDQVRKWTWETNLFEKDYVFMPILRRSHWSLIIICYLSTLTSSPDKYKGSPCVFHLDPLEGIHENFEGQVRRYLYRACRESYQASKKKDDMLEALACNIKYVEAQVPRQDNSYDCGLYVLHYVETFIRESMSPDFSFVTSEGSPHLSSLHFAREVSGKRVVIQHLIHELSENRQEPASRRLGIQPKPKPRAQDAHCPRRQPKRLPKPPKGQNKVILSKKWNEKETSVLLNCLVKRGRIRKGMEGATHWNRSSEDIKTKCKTVRSEVECRRRYDTLLKAYKRIKKIGKPFRDITDTERLGLHLATPLQEEWYKAIDTICLQLFQRRSDNAKSRKRAKLNPSDGNGMVSSSPRIPPPPLIPFGCAEREKPFRKKVAIPGFSTLDENLRSTLLNLIQALSMKDWSARNWRSSDDPTIFELEVVCQWLEIVQDRKPLDIRKFLLRLSERKLVKMEFEEKDLFVAEEVLWLEVSDVRAYKKFVEKVLCKYPHLMTYLQICGKYDSVSFPKAPLSFSLQRFRVVILYECEELEHADLSYFPKLRSLAIEKCPKLKTVTGWEDVAKELGWLEIRECPSYRDLPCVECLPSLREFCLGNFECLPFQMIPAPDFSQCVRLRRLEFSDTDLSALNRIDLSTLRFLEVLTFWNCCALTTIQGLSGLHSLTHLDLRCCRALRSVPELGCLKALTHLDMSWSGVEEIPGVQELRLLTLLVLCDCSSLKSLPWLGHLKALTYLAIIGSSVEEIPGVEGLVSLEVLQCNGSRVRWLPDPHHFPRLRRVGVRGTPLSTSEPSSWYYGKGWLELNCEEKKMGFVDEISDVSDTEDNHSDDESS